MAVLVVSIWFHIASIPQVAVFVKEMSKQIKCPCCGKIIEYDKPLQKPQVHRLAVGDCTDKAVVERVMQGEKAALTVTDPPYNALKSWGKDEAHSETRLDPSKWFANDNMEWGEYGLFLAKAFSNFAGHSLYVCCDYRVYPMMVGAVESIGYEVKHCIVWKKTVWGLGKRYRFQHEFIIYACKGDAPFYGDRSESDVWEIDTVRNDEHMTPKPVELAERAMRNSSQIGDTVFDPFLGSGTTMVAAQRLGRICMGIEIDPGYCAVVLQRYKDLTGESPVLLGN